MPAIWPPESPVLEGEAVPPAGVLVEVEVEVEVDVAEGKRGGMEAVEGSGIPVQRVLTFESAQQESVALGELVAQKAQRPGRLVE